MRDPSVNNWKCKQCSKKCLLYQDANKIDSKLIEEIRKRKEHEEAGEGTSQQPQHSGETNLNQQQSSSSNNGAAQDDPRVQPAVRERAMAANRFANLVDQSSDESSSGDESSSDETSSDED